MSDLYKVWVSQGLSETIQWAEERFLCATGQQGGFMSNNEHSAPYQTAAFCAPLSDLDEDRAAMLLRGVMKLMLSSMKMEGATRIFWRNGWRMAFSKAHDCALGGDLLRLHARLVAFDETWRMVSVPPWFHHGQLGRVLTKEELEDCLVTPSPGPQ